MKKAVAECSGQSMEVLESQRGGRPVSLGERVVGGASRHGCRSWKWMSFIKIQWRKDVTAGKIFLFEVGSVLSYYPPRLDDAVGICI